MTAKHQLHEHEDLLLAPKLSAGRKQAEKNLMPMAKCDPNPTSYMLWVCSVMEVG